MLYWIRFTHTSTLIQPGHCGRILLPRSGQVGIKWSAVVEAVWRAVLSPDDLPEYDLFLYVRSFPQHASDTNRGSLPRYSPCPKVGSVLPSAEVQPEKDCAGDFL